MQSIEEICNEYADVVYRYLLYLTQNQELSEDLMQETFCIAIKDINKFREECPINVWLCRIAKNLWYKHLRQKYDNKITNLDDINIPDEMSIEEDFLDKESRLEIYSYINRLNIKDAKVIKLRIILGLSFKEIGSTFGKNETWARVTFYRGKEKLKKLMREESNNEKE